MVGNGGVEGEGDVASRSGCTPSRGRSARTHARLRCVAVVCCLGVGASAAAWAATVAKPSDPPAAASPGVRLSFGTRTLATDAHVMGGQVVLDWAQVEPKNGTFC